MRLWAHLRQVLSGDLPREPAGSASGEVVFAGYGIVSPGEGEIVGGIGSLFVVGLHL